MNPAPELRARTAAALLAGAERSARLTAFAGLDGFVDTIVHLVDQRQNAREFTPIPTIAALGARISAAAGRSTNIETVVERRKLGGNGPILAHALARLGPRVTYLGALGWPALHPVFQDLARHASVHSLGDPGFTDALEFTDGKVMLTHTTPLNDITWPNIEARFGREKFAAQFAAADLVAFVNWTMVPGMSDIWEKILQELCPALAGPRRKIFFDLADPQKRTPDDLRRALALIARFQNHFDVLLGLNEKEAHALGAVLGLPAPDGTPDGLAALALGLARAVPVATLVVHPVTYALAVTAGQVARVGGPRIAQPKITTGAGDHFNAGFCLGKLLGLDDEAALLTGVTTSGYYVQTASSPAPANLAQMLRDWPAR